VVSYLSCVVALVFDAMILSHSFTHTQYLGAAILSIAGGLATYLNARKMEHFG
jgi:drug/metabolite transporter (DMT)-like permease